MEFFKKIKFELDKRLPGSRFQYLMSPSVRRFKPFRKRGKINFKNSGVLILLYPIGNKIKTCFIKRPAGDYRHNNQISLPGGKFEKGKDKSIIETALREAQEEVGINPKSVNILGCLSPLHIPVSYFYVLPVIGYMNSAPQFLPNAKEVEKIIEVDIDHFTYNAVKTKNMFVDAEEPIKAPYFNTSEEPIWGATAMILSEFREILKRVKIKDKGFKLA